PAVGPQCPRGDEPLAPFPRGPARDGACQSKQTRRMTSRPFIRPPRPLFAERQLWNVRVFPASVRLDARELDHLAPLLDFFGDQLAEGGRRAWECGGSPLGKPRLHIGIRKRRDGPRVALVPPASTLGAL